MKTSKRKLSVEVSAVVTAILVLVSGGGTNTVNAAETLSQVVQTDPPYNCSAESSWFLTPSLPTEVKQSNGPGDSSFCDFYQFSWQTFAYLMATSSNNPKVRNFQDNAQYHELEVDEKGLPANSCDDKHDAHTLFIRAAKPQENGTEFTIPERIGQAGGGATIYDQNSNVVYYDVRFSKNMCDVKSIQQQANFPGGTTEIKTAWKVLGANDDASQYVTMDANITPVTPDQKNTQTTKLGMVGFHLAVATPNHPEFVWATFEHKVNAPDCTSPETTQGWSFASENCSADLTAKDGLGIVQCRFNNPAAETKITGKPTQICREYAYGSAVGDLKYDENTQDIKSLNANVQPYLTGGFKVLSNYFNVGALWVSDIEKGSYVPPIKGKQVSQIDNQRGSLRLANTVAETEFQNVNTAATNASHPNQPGFVSNCFGCHNYEGKASNISNTTSNSLSHIFDDIAIGSNQCLDMQASNIINSQTQAQTDCPTVCSNLSKQLKWDGQWTNQNATTGEQLGKTVCGCCKI
jgi:hypothetical protein